MGWRCSPLCTCGRSLHAGGALPGARRRRSSTSTSAAVAMSPWGWWGSAAFCTCSYGTPFDRFAAASAEVGRRFSLVMLTTGPSGEADLGHVVDVGRSARAHPVPLLPLYRLPALRGRQEPGLRPATRRCWNLRSRLAPLHPPERLPVPHAASPAYRPQAERAVAPGEHAGHAAASFAVFTLLYVGFVTQRYAVSLLREARAGEGRGRGTMLEVPQNGGYMWRLRRNGGDPARLRAVAVRRTTKP